MDPLFLNFLLLIFIIISLGSPFFHTFQFINIPSQWAFTSHEFCSFYLIHFVFTEMPFMYTLSNLILPSQVGVFVTTAVAVRKLKAVMISVLRDTWEYVEYVCMKNIWPRDVTCQLGAKHKANFTVTKTIYLWIHKNKHRDFF
jgi:ABC-type dipeptide/oligopeptide/nickel transport system permease component